MKTSMKIVALLLIVSPVFSQIPVFTAGENGYHTFRIPAIVKSTNGTLLAFAEGRKNGTADFGDIDLVMKTSQNNGNTWSNLVVLVDEKDLQAGNPGPVVDVLQNQVLLFYNTGNNHEHEVRKGNGERRVQFILSKDHGKSWSSPRDISPWVHQLEQENPWRCYAITPGHAIQATRGKYKGRIFVAANHSQGEPQQDWSDYRSHGFYTEDFGKTFHLTPTLKYPGSNEATAAFLGKKLILNARDQSGKSRRRVVAVSRDGGVSWKNEYVDTVLLDPINQGSLLLLEDGKTLAFSNAHHEQERNNLSIHISKNGGKSWYKRISIDRTEEPDKKKNYTAYSDLVNLNTKSLGILYEQNNYTEIVFKEVKWREGW